MKIKLPETKSKLYTGNPLKLEDGEVRDVEHNKEIDLLLNEGAIEPATSTPTIESKPRKEPKNIPKELPKKVIVTKPIVRPIVTRTPQTIKTAPILKKKGFQRR